MIQRVRSEEGFTLVELLVAVVIAGIVVGSVAGGLIVLLKINNNVTNRLLAGHDRFLLSAYLTYDVQSASGLPTVTNAGAACSNTPTKVLDFFWVEYPDVVTTNSYDSSYFILTRDGECQLTRTVSVNGAVSTTQTVSHGLVTASSPVAVTTSGSSVGVTLKEGFGSNFTVSASRRSP